MAFSDKQVSILQQLIANPTPDTHPELNTGGFETSNQYDAELLRQAQAEGTIFSIKSLKSGTDYAVQVPPSAVVTENSVKVMLVGIGDVKLEAVEMRKLTLIAKDHPSGAKAIEAQPGW